MRRDLPEGDFGGARGECSLLWHDAAMRPKLGSPDTSRLPVPYPAVARLLRPSRGPYEQRPGLMPGCVHRNRPVRNGLADHIGSGC